MSKLLAELHTEQLNQPSHDRCQCRQHGRTLAMDFHLDMVVDTIHQHVSMRRTIEPVSKITHNKRGHLVDLGSSECGRREHPSALALTTVGGNRHLKANEFDLRRANGVWGGWR